MKKEKKHRPDAARSKHTPTPWTLSTKTEHASIVGSDQAFLGHIYCTDTDPQQMANAAFIVRAVNNHAALMGALKKFIAIENTYNESDNLLEAMTVAKAVYAAAKGDA